MGIYLNILLQVAKELEMPVTEKPFYDDRAALERAAAARDGDVHLLEGEGRDRGDDLLGDRADDVVQGGHGTNAPFQDQQYGSERAVEPP